LAATRGTARDLYDAGIVCETVLKSDDGHPNIIDHMRNKRIDLLINTPMGKRGRKDAENLRSEAMRMKIPYTTTTSAAWAVVEAVRYLQERKIEVVSL
ncbi:MAG: hypothetical protein PHR10_06985, partial [Sphaerochaetaceae bacterium]|nr:hypothetical protein [Sphaerochaetaceae bacterium]